MPSDLREFLRSASALPSDPLDIDHALRRGRRRRSARRLGVTAISLTFIVAATALVARIPSAERDEGTRPQQPAQTEADITPRVTAKIDVGPTPQVVAVDTSGVWVSVLDEDGSNEGFSLVMINPETNDIETRFSTENSIETSAPAKAPYGPPGSTRTSSKRYSSRSTHKPVTGSECFPEFVAPR
jgi:hypothetical protein